MTYVPPDEDDFEMKANIAVGQNFSRYFDVQVERSDTGGVLTTVPVITYVCAIIPE